MNSKPIFKSNGYGNNHENSKEIKKHNWKEKTGTKIDPGMSF